MQGVPYINLAKLWWAKVIWSILLLCAVGAMSLHLWYLFDQWYSYPKSTKITLGFDDLPLPQVTICNTNVMHKDRLNYFEGLDELKALTDALLPNNLVPDQFEGSVTTNVPTFGTTESGSVTNIPPGTSEKPSDNQVSTPQVSRDYGNYESINYTQFIDDWWYEETEDEDYFDAEIDDFFVLQELFFALFMEIKKSDRSKLGHQISDMLVDCTFNGRKCDPSMFKLHQTSEYGNCWTIAERGFKVRSPGPKGGLSVILFLETNEYLRGLTTGFGTRVVVQERNTYPFPSHEGMFIPASMETDIGLKMQSITRLGGRFGTCDDGQSFQKSLNLTYSRRACQTFCQVTTVIDKCSCFDQSAEEYAITKNSTLKPCRSKKDLQCLDKIRRDSSNQNTCKCDKPCREVAYLKTLSMRQWPSDEYAKVLLDWVCDRYTDTCLNLKERITAKDLNNNFLKLNIYYEDLNFENITEVAQIEIQQFLSDVGGAVGLWIGLSILSVCELIQLFVEIIDYALHRSRNPGSRDSKRSNETERKNNSSTDDMHYDDRKRQYRPSHQNDRHLNSDKAYFGAQFIPRVHSPYLEPHSDAFRDPRDYKHREPRDNRHHEPRDGRRREPRDGRHRESRDNTPYAVQDDQKYHNDY
ncbi:hypothetical protein ACF0H5_004885 [Mactra antiquata]